MANNRNHININLGFEADDDKLKAFTKAVNNSFNSLAKSSLKLSKTLNGLGTSLNNTLTRLESATDRMNKAIAGIDIAKLNQLGTTLKNSFSGITGLGNALKGFNAKQLKNIEKFPEAFNKLETSLARALDNNFVQKAENVAKAINKVAVAISQLNKARQEYAQGPKTVIDLPQTRGRQPREQAQTQPLQPRAPGNRKGDKTFFGFQSVDEILPARGPIVQLTGLLFLLQGAFFGIERAVQRVSDVVLGANKQLEQQVISLTAITGSAEKAEKVITDFALPFAANVPFFKSKEIIENVERLAAEGFGIDQITGRLEAGFNKFNGKFEREFEGGLVKVLASAAVAFGTTLDRSTDAFISAIQGRFTKIRRFGINKDDLKQFGFVEGGSDSQNAFALQQLLELRFGDLVRQQSKTFQGAVSNIQDVLSNISRAAFEETFNRISSALQNVVENLTIFEQTFALALKTQEEFDKKLKELDPRAQRIAENLRSVSQVLGKFTDFVVKAVGVIARFKEVAATALVAPVTLLLINGLTFGFQKLTLSVANFFGILDKEGKLGVPKFIGRINELAAKLAQPFKKFDLDIFDNTGAKVGTKTVSNFSLALQKLSTAFRNIQLANANFIKSIGTLSVRMNILVQQVLPKLMRFYGALTLSQANAGKGALFLAATFGKVSNLIGRSLPALAVFNSALGAIYNTIRSFKGVSLFGKLAIQSTTLANLISGLGPIFNTLKVGLGGVVGVGVKLVGVLGAITSAVGAVVSALTSGFAFVVKSAFAIASVAVSSFLGVFRFFLLPAILEAIFALKDLSKGIQTLKTRALDGFIESAKRLGTAFQGLIRAFALQLGFFVDFNEQSGYNLKILSKMLDLLTSIVNKLREIAPELAVIAEDFVRTSGVILKMISLLIRGMGKFVQAVKLSGQYLKSVDPNPLNTFLNLVKNFGGFSESTAGANEFTDALGKTSDALDKVADKLQLFQRGASLSNAKQFVNENLVQKSFSKGFKNFQAQVNKEDKGELVRSLFDSKFIGGKPAARIAEQLNRALSARTFEMTDVEGNVTKLSFSELLKEGTPAEAFKQFAERATPILQKELDKIKLNPNLGPGVQKTIIDRYNQTISNLKALSDSAQAFGLITGKIEKGTQDTINGVKNAVKESKKAADEIDKVFQEIGEGERAARQDIFFTKLSGGTEDAIQNASKVLDKRIVEGFKTRLETLPAQTELTRDAEKKAIDLRQELERLQKDAKSVSDQGVAALRAILNTQFPKEAAKIKDDFLKDIVESNNPLAAAEALRQALAAEGATATESEIGNLYEEITRTVKNAAQQFQNLQAGIKGVEEQSKDADQIFQRLQKQLNENVEAAKENLKQSRALVSNELELGNISLRTAIATLEAQRKLIQQNKQLEADKEEQLAVLKEEVSLKKELIQALSQEFKDTSKNNKNAVRSYQDVVDTFLATRDILNSLPEGTKNLPATLEDARKNQEELTKATVEFIDKQREARNQLAEVATKFQEIQSGIRSSQASFDIVASSLPKDRIDAVLRSQEAVQLRRDAQQKIVDLQSTLNKAAASEALIQEKINNNLRSIADLKETAKLQGDASINSAKVEELIQENLNLELEKRTALAEKLTTLQNAQTDALKTQEELQRKEFDLLKQQAQKAQEIADIRKKTNSDLLSFQQKLLKLATGRDELTTNQQNFFLRQEIENTAQRLASAIKPADKLAIGNELADLLLQARESGAFTGDPQRFQELERELRRLNVRVQKADPVAEQRREFNQLEQNLQAVRQNMIDLASSFKVFTAELVKTQQVLNQNASQVLTGVQEVFPAQKLEITGAQILTDRFENAQRQGGFSPRVGGDFDALVRQSVATNSTLSRNPNNNLLDRTLSGVFQNVEKNNSTLLNFQRVVAQSQLQESKALNETVTQLSTFSDRLNVYSQNVGGLISALGKASANIPSVSFDPESLVSRLTVAEERLIQLEQTARTPVGINEQPAQAVETQVGGNLQATLDTVNRSLENLALVAQEEKDVNINLMMSPDFSGDEFRRLLLNTVFNSLTAAKNPNDLR